MSTLWTNTIYRENNGNIQEQRKEKKLSKKNMPETWRSCLADPSKYKIISPEILLKKYLGKRYWDEHASRIIRINTDLRIKI